jgi:hypothetical protein
MTRRYPDFSRPLPQPVTWRDFGWALGVLIFGLLLIAVFWFAAAPYAKARDLGQWENSDPRVRQWFETLMQPDNPGVRCCGEADGYWADRVEIKDGKVFAFITDTRPDGPLGRRHIPPGTKIEVPPHKLKWDRGNPTGHTVIFIGAGGDVLCFVQATGT